MGSNRSQALIGFPFPCIAFEAPSPTAVPHYNHVFVTSRFACFIVRVFCSFYAVGRSRRYVLLD